MSAYIIFLASIVISSNTLAAKTGIYKISPNKEIFLVVHIDEAARSIMKIISQNPDKKPLWSCENQEVICGDEKETVAMCSNYGGKDAKFLNANNPPLATLTCEILRELR